MLMENGAKVNKAVQNHGTALISATREGHLEIVKYLLSKGANINQTVENIGTPLLYAARNGQLETVKYLISENAKTTMISFLTFCTLREVKTESAMQ